MNVPPLMMGLVDWENIVASTKMGKGEGDGIVQNSVWVTLPVGFRGCGPLSLSYSKYMRLDLHSMSMSRVLVSLTAVGAAFRTSPFFTAPPEPRQNLVM
jgi:hypothetical protein